MSALRATFQRLLHATAGLLAVAAATALSAAPRINEVVFQGGAPQPENEWIEIYNPDGGAVVMTGYTLSNQGAFSYTFPTFTLGAGAYVVVHLGTGIDTGSNLYVGAVTEQLDNAGDDLVLTTAGSSVIDYIAWGSGGAIDPPPVGPSWRVAKTRSGRRSPSTKATPNPAPTTGPAPRGPMS